jgi:excisionase family DNA binding protein
MKSKDILTPTQVAALLSVSPVTVRQWAQKGLIEARLTAGGHRRYTRAAVIDFARRMALALPDGFARSDDSRVLVVDDDRELNDGIAAFVQTQYPGIAVAQAYDAFDAGRQVARFKPTLLLLDVAMAGIDGNDVCRRVKSGADAAGLRVIAMSAHVNPALEQEIIAAGAERVLKKPFTPEELVEACGAIGTKAVQQT